MVKVHLFINPHMHNPTNGPLRFPTGSPGDSFNCDTSLAFTESSALCCVSLLITDKVDCDVALGGPRRGLDDSSGEG